MSRIHETVGVALRTSSRSQTCHCSKSALTDIVEEVRVGRLSATTKSGVDGERWRIDEVRRQVVRFTVIFPRLLLPTNWSRAVNNMYKIYYKSIDTSIPPHPVRFQEKPQSRKTRWGPSATSRPLYTTRVNDFDAICTAGGIHLLNALPPKERDVSDTRDPS